MDAYRSSWVHTDVHLQEMSKNSKIDAKKMYSAREAATMLGVTPDTVKAYCRDRKVTGKQVGPKRSWVIPGSEISRLLAEWNLN